MKRTRKQSITFNIPTLTLEGGLFLPDQLEKAVLGEADFQSESDYQTPKGLRIKDDYSRAFQIACAQWQQFSEQLERTDINTTQVTKDFVFELLKDVFGYAQITHIAGIQASERHYPAQLLAGSVPIVVAPFNFGLDESHEGFAVANIQWQDKSRKKSAFQMAQELLNASDEHLWALVTNGKQIRLLRDAASLTRPSFLEIDLQDILQGKRFSEFANVWRLIHASRFNQAANPEQCIWEKWRESGKQEGSRVRDGLRNGVENALLVLGQGFIQYPTNQTLRDALLSGELSKNDFFQELLRLVYRFIFLFNVEERGILHTEDNSKAAIQARQAYALGYALARLRNTCLKRRARNQFTDQWQAIKVVFKGLEDGQPLIALPALGGLFASHQCKFLDQSSLDNAFLLTAMESLRWANLAGTKTLIDYRNMDTEELGSVYESLLELVPEIDVHARKFGFVGITSEGSTAGNARKISGSYYTPDSLVQELIKSALEPVIEERIKQNPDNPTDALLAIRVIDPACGSGHFLLAAARKLAERLAQLRAPEGAVKPKDYRQALHDVIRNCIFGVDRNPMALDLARTALWIEGFAEDEPLSFLDHHLQCGDALLGLMDLKALELGIPKDAFKPLSGDDNQVCKELAKQNTVELKDLQRKRLFKAREMFASDNGLEALKAIEKMPERTTKQIAAKEQAYQQFLTQATESPLRHAADMFLGAFLINKTAQNQQQVPTTASVILELLGENSPAQQQKRALATQACQKGFVLHWPLAFPQVFAQGGFDCVLGNPPWERIKLQEEEFFASRNPNIAQARNKAERSQRIQWLSEGKLAEHLYPSLQHTEVERQAEKNLFGEFVVAKRTAEAASVFFHVKGDEGGRYPLTGVGDVNTYALFSESISQITSENGRAGFIVPSGIATDNTTRFYFQSLIKDKRLISLYGFDNALKIFPSVHTDTPFSLLTIGKSQDIHSDFAHYLLSILDLNDTKRHFKLSTEDFILINPNTLTCPVFRSVRDAELTKKLFRHAPVLINESKEDGNPWGITFMTMFHMSNDSHLFEDAQGEGLLPLYEAKMIHQYDHRWATYDGEDSRDATLKEKQDSSFEVRPRYWLNETLVSEVFETKSWKYNWFFGWRGITNATNERSLISSVIPFSGVGNSAHLLIFDSKINAKQVACLQANTSSLIADFATRQKLGGLNFNFFISKQLPIFSPSNYDEVCLSFIVPRVLELTYTSNSLKGWAKDLGYEGPVFKFEPVRRARLSAELDAYYAKLYGLTRDELRYILDPADVMGDDYPSETFRVLKNNEIKEFGEYRTRRLVLEAWDKLERGELV